MNIVKKNKKSLCVALASNRKEKKNKMSQEDELKFFNQYEIILRQS